MIIQITACVGVSNSLHLLGSLGYIQEARHYKLLAGMVEAEIKFEQCPRRLGKQDSQLSPFFTQLQFLQRPSRLQRQQLFEKIPGPGFSSTSPANKRRKKISQAGFLL